jgi:hypothetical protein
MLELLRADIARHPNAFVLNGPIPPAELETWLVARNLTVPDDLKRVWRETGGGDMFESETILGPYGKVELADDVDTVNQFHRKRGMPADWLVIATGMGELTVLRMSVGEYANVSYDSYHVTECFVSLLEWYARIRNEIGPQYGLSQ